MNMIKQVATALPRVKSGHRSVGRKAFEFRPKLSLLPSVCVSIHPTYSENEYLTMLNAWKRYIERTISCEGIVHGVKKYKLVRTYTFQLVEGRDPEPLAWIACGRKDHIPSCLDKMRPLIKEASLGNQRAYQALNTLLFSSRILESPTPGNFETITEGIDSIDPKILNKFRTFVRNRLRRRGWRIPTDFTFKVSSRTGSKGPNGKPRVESAFSEAISLVKGPLWEPFKQLSEAFGFSFLNRYLTELVSSRHSTNGAPARLRLLTTVTDSDLKMRVVAISDFWTQTLLEALMPYLKGVLNTYFKNSSAFYDHLKGFRKGQNHPWANELRSYDLDSWTDRFHHDLQYVVMEELFGTTIAKNWFDLVVACDWYAPRLKQFLKYKQGQGMGTTGSFLIATITDHFFIEMVMSDHYGKKFRPSTWYNKVGDDLWIRDPDGIMPQKYEEIGSKVNLDKSKVPTSKGNFLEYVSRVAMDGHDVSRVSPKVINRANDWRYVPVLLSVAQAAGITIPAERLSALDRIIKGTDRTYRSRLADLLCTLKWTEDPEYFPEVFRLQWEEILQQGYLKEATMQWDDPIQKENFRNASDISLIIGMNSKLQQAQMNLYDSLDPQGVQGDPDATDDRKEPITAATEAQVFDVDSSFHTRIASLPGIVKYQGQDGNLVLHPKSAMAFISFKHDWKVIHEDTDDVMVLNPERRKAYRELELAFLFKDFKSMKETKSLEHTIQRNLKVLQLYDPVAETIAIDGGWMFGHLKIGRVKVVAVKQKSPSG